MQKKIVSYSVLIILLSIFLTYVATSVINNPDIIAYMSLIDMTSSVGLGRVEPVLALFAIPAKYFSQSLPVSSIYVFYFSYILLIQLFLFFGFFNLFEGRANKSFVVLLFWNLSYGLIHGLIQIRFGLANAVSMYVFSLLFLNSSKTRIGLHSTFSFFTHYSSVLIVLSNLYVKLVKKIQLKYKIFSIHMAVILALYLFKIGALFGFLPDFMYRRIVAYLSLGKTVSQSVIIISVILYILLIFSPRIKNVKINSLRLFGAISFIPYFIVPEYEILIRVGMGFQYLLIPYLFLTYKCKKMLFFTTLPLLSFYLYKLYSSFNALIQYL